MEPVRTVWAGEVRTAGWPGPLRFNWTFLTSARASISWLVVALMASESGVTFCRNPRSDLSPDRKTRTSAPGASWLSLAQRSVDAGFCASAVPASAANNNHTILTCIIGMVTDHITGALLAG